MIERINPCAHSISWSSVPAGGKSMAVMCFCSTFAIATAFWWCGIIWRAKVANLEVEVDGTEMAMSWCILQSIDSRQVAYAPEAPAPQRKWAFSHVEGAS